MIVVVVVLAVVIVVLSLKSAHARAAAKEPPGRVIGTSFHLVATFFSMIFISLFCSQKRKIFKRRYQNTPTIHEKNLTLA